MHDIPRTPDVTVFGLVMPIAVFIEIFIPDDVARDVLCGARLTLPGFAIVRPVFETGARRKRLPLCAELLEAAECCLLI